MSKQKITENSDIKKTTKPRRLFLKKMVIELVGPSTAAINRVARAIHAIDAEDRVGGADERRVYMTCESSDVKQIYHGNI